MRKYKKKKEKKKKNFKSTHNPAMQRNYIWCTYLQIFFSVVYVSLNVLIYAIYFTGHFVISNYVP